MALATMISLAGNIQLALPGHPTSPFAWLEAITPPLLVLSTAYVLKEQVLQTIEQRHADECAFQSGLLEWCAATAEPEQHPNWSHVYANALRDALWKANARRKETLGQMAQANWCTAVSHEMQAETWFDEPERHSEAFIALTQTPNTTRSPIETDTTPSQKRASPPGEALRGVRRSAPGAIRVGRTAPRVLFKCVSAASQT